jgi:hypothetical protein
VGIPKLIALVIEMAIKQVLYLELNNSISLRQAIAYPQIDQRESVSGVMFRVADISWY